MSNLDKREDIFKEYLNNGIEKVYNEHYLRALLSRGTNLSRFNAVNRLLILGQTDEATTDARTWVGWRKVGRDTNKDIKPITILLPITEYKYLDPENGTEVTSKDLNPLEMRRAIEYGVVSKQEEIKAMVPVEVYVKEQTRGEAVEAGNRISLADYIDFIYSHTTGKVIKGDKAYTEENNIYISDNDARASAQEVCNYIAKNVTESIEIREIRFKERALVFAMMSIMHAEYTEEIMEALEKEAYSIEEYGNLLIETDTFIMNVLTCINKEAIIEDNSSEMINEQKGRAMANIYEAMEVRNVSKNINTTRLVDRMLKLRT